MSICAVLCTVTLVLSTVSPVFFAKEKLTVLNPPPGSIAVMVALPSVTLESSPASWASIAFVVYTLTEANAIPHMMPEATPAVMEYFHDLLLLPNFKESISAMVSRHGRMDHHRTVSLRNCGSGVWIACRIMFSGIIFFCNGFNGFLRLKFGWLCHLDRIPKEHGFWYLWLICIALSGRVWYEGLARRN